MFSSKNSRPFGFEIVLTFQIGQGDIVEIPALDVEAVVTAAEGIDEFVAERYASYKSGIGAEIVNGTATLESLSAYAMTLEKVAPASGKQEYLETVVNSILFS